MHKQKSITWDAKDYTYIEFYRKAYENSYDDYNKDIIFDMLQTSEVERDYFTGSLMQIKHLIQFDPKPNRELKEVRSEIFKISLSFPGISMI